MYCHLPRNVKMQNISTNARTVSRSEKVDLWFTNLLRRNWWDCPSCWSYLNTITARPLPPSPQMPAMGSRSPSTTIWPGQKYLLRTVPGSVSVARGVTRTQILLPVLGELSLFLDMNRSRFKWGLWALKYFKTALFMILKNWWKFQVKAVVFLHD